MIKRMGIPLKIAIFFIKFYTKMQNLNNDQVCHRNPETPTDNQKQVLLSYFGSVILPPTDKLGEKFSTSAVSS